MKFFDLEMDGCLARVSNKKGGRDIQFRDVVNDECKIMIYHGGQYYFQCGMSSFTNQSDCETNRYIER